MCWVLDGKDDGCVLEEGIKWVCAGVQSHVMHGMLGETESQAGGGSGKSPVRRLAVLEEQKQVRALPFSHSKPH